MGADRRRACQVGAIGGGGPHSALVATIIRLLGSYAAPRRLCVIYGENAGFFLRRNPDALRSPDAAFVVKERLFSGRSAAVFRQIAPALVVEVVSPNDWTAEVQRKTTMWLEAGTRLVLVVYPQAQTIAVHRSLPRVTNRRHGDSVDCQSVFPELLRSAEELSTAWTSRAARAPGGHYPQESDHCRHGKERPIPRIVLLTPNAVTPKAGGDAC